LLYIPANGVTGNKLGHLANGSDSGLSHLADKSERRNQGHLSRGDNFARDDNPAKDNNFSRDDNFTREDNFSRDDISRYENL
jgi:hypothetical protein